MSINGTTFISVNVPRFLPPTCVPIIHLAKNSPGEEDSHNPAKNHEPQNSAELLSGFELRGDQTDFVDSSAAHDINGAGHFFKQHRILPFAKRDLFRAVL